MCEMCNDGREYAPIILVCRTSELAQAFCTIVTHLGGSKKDTDGSEMPPYVLAERVIMPWWGHPEFMNAVTMLALRTNVAEPVEIREMQFGAMAQGLNVDVEDIRESLTVVADTMERLREKIGTKTPPPIDAMLNTLDAELEVLQRQHGEE